jgi:hypothetical protein
MHFSYLFLPTQVHDEPFFFWGSVAVRSEPPPVEHFITQRVKDKNAGVEIEYFKCDDGRKEIWDKSCESENTRLVGNTLDCIKNLNEAFPLWTTTLNFFKKMKKNERRLSLKPK